MFQRRDLLISSIITEELRFHPNQHTAEELSLIKRVYSKFKHEGLAQVYTEAKKRGYTRFYGSMCCQIRRQIRRHIPKTKESKQYYKSNWKPDVVAYPGEKVSN